MTERETTTTAGPDLSVCPECDRDFVYPVEWATASETLWEVLLRCPNCDWTRVGAFDQPTLERLDERLDDGMEQLERDLERLERANLEEHVERFAAALHAGAILPEDF
jgi:hypothetical protein